MKIWFVTLFPFLVGCATTAHQTKEILRNPPKVARAAEVPNVPFIAQSEGDCGPTTLAIAMQWQGESTTAAELAPQVMTPGKRGSLPIDMISASRRNGKMAVQIDGLANLVREIDGGHPAIVFQNLGLSWIPRWHYAVVYGYDLDRKELIMHTAGEASKRVRMDEFERTWRLADYWALVVLPPQKLSISADELAQMKAAAGLEQVAKTKEARIAYNKILERWPKSLSAMIGLGNLAYQSGEYKEAVRVLKRAVQLHPDSEIAKNNLEVAKQSL